MNSSARKLTVLGIMAVFTLTFYCVDKTDQKALAMTYGNVYETTHYSLTGWGKHITINNTDFVSSGQAKAIYKNREYAFHQSDCRDGYTILDPEGVTVSTALAPFKSGFKAAHIEVGNFIADQNYPQNHNHMDPAPEHSDLITRRHPGPYNESGNRRDGNPYSLLPVIATDAQAGVQYVGKEVYDVFFETNIGFTYFDQQGLRVPNQGLIPKADAFMPKLNRRFVQVNICQRVPMQGGGGGGIGQECGDGLCDIMMGEDYVTCAADCPYTVECGDGTCEEGEEDETSCPADCGPIAYCGDGICDMHENGDDCSTDCYADYCGDSVCDAHIENSTNCPVDCAAGGSETDCSNALDDDADGDTDCDDMDCMADPACMM